MGSYAEIIFGKVIQIYVAEGFGSAAKLNGIIGFFKNKQKKFFYSILYEKILIINPDTFNPFEEVLTEAKSDETMMHSSEDLCECVPFVSAFFQLPKSLS